MPDPGTVLSRLTERLAPLERSDLHPRSGKDQHAFCLDVDRAGATRPWRDLVASATGRPIGPAAFLAGLAA